MTGPSMAAQFARRVLHRYGYDAETASRMCRGNAHTLSVRDAATGCAPTSRSSPTLLQVSAGGVVIAEHRAADLDDAMRIGDLIDSLLGPLVEANDARL